MDSLMVVAGYMLPSSLPFNYVSTRLIAFAAPVELGTMLAAAALARRRSPFACGASSVFWSFVYAWIVVMMPASIPNTSFNTFAIGARQLVVHEAQEIIVSEPSSI